MRSSSESDDLGMTMAILFGSFPSGSPPLSATCVPQAWVRCHGAPLSCRAQEVAMGNDAGEMNWGRVLGRGCIYGEEVDGGDIRRGEKFRRGDTCRWSFCPPAVCLTTAAERGRCSRWRLPLAAPRVVRPFDLTADIIALRFASRLNAQIRDVRPSVRIVRDITNFRSFFSNAGCVGRGLHSIDTGMFTISERRNRKMVINKLPVK
jgi:hypothetical protein